MLFFITVICRPSMKGMQKIMIYPSGNRIPIMTNHYQNLDQAPSIVLPGRSSASQAQLKRTT